MKNIHVDFEKSRGKSILFLGKMHSLSQKELQLFLEKFEITYTDTLNEDVTMFVESTIISPLEEQIAYAAFSQKIPAYSTDQFDALYAKALHSDSLLMSLKLSNDQKKLTRLLQNRHLDNPLFLKLFRMYDWQDEGLFDNSENMEVSTLFAKRFYTKKRFDPATFHSPISIFEIAIMSKDADILEAIFNLPEMHIKQSRTKQKRPVTLKQALATNEALNLYTLQRLLRVNDKEIDYFLAQNHLIDDKITQTLLDRANDQTKQALACNTEISDTIFTQLLQEEIAIEMLLAFQRINLDRFSIIKTLHASIGENETLAPEVIEKLIRQNRKDIMQNLSANETLTQNQLNKIYTLDEVDYFPYLASNPNLAKHLLNELYKKKIFDIDRYLALNPNTPMDILEALYQRDNFELNQSLALNESLPIAYLQQLQLDTRLMHYLKENKTFTENILNGLGI
ncbi:MAG: hypothetical protein K0U47_06090 [Epsilonproteobacteria bacterium]|nr:hypothetical protein [Campylobacterota bacterium]